MGKGTRVLGGASRLTCLNWLRLSKSENSIAFSYSTRLRSRCDAKRPHSDSVVRSSCCENEQAFERSQSVTYLPKHELVMHVLRHDRRVGDGQRVRVLHQELVNLETRAAGDSTCTHWGVSTLSLTLVAPSSSDHPPVVL